MGKYNIESLSSFYKTQIGSCLELTLIDTISQIVLIRHAKPNVDRPIRVNFDEAEQYLNAYRASGITSFDDSPICIGNLPEMKIYHSDLNRARQTAEAIFMDSKFTLVRDSRFREFDRENLKIPFRIKHKTHTKLSRIAWIVGAKKGAESRRNAFKRVTGNADHLNELSDSERLIILVAHGFHNYFLAKRLIKLGWTKVHDSGNDHLSVKILANPK